MDLVWRTGDPMQEDANADMTDNEKKFGRVTAEEIDEESGEYLPEKRPTHLMNTVLVTFTLLLITVMLGAGFRQIAIEVAVDHNYLRVAFILLTPIQIFFTLFFAQVIVGCIAQSIGTIRQMKENSRFYSAILPRRLIRQPL